jgi:hypothetical protein
MLNERALRLQMQALSQVRSRCSRYAWYMRRLPQVLLGLAIVPAALIIWFGAGFGFGGTSQKRTAPAVAVPTGYVGEARATATRFFRAMDSRRFETVCNLLSEGFYRLNGINSRQLCVLSLRYTMSPSGVRFRILGAQADREKATVQVLADGVPGELLLVRDRGRFRVLSLGARAG